MIATQKQAATATSHRAFTASPVAVRRAQAVRVRATEPQSAAGPNTTTTAEGIIPRTTQDVSEQSQLCVLEAAAQALCIAGQRVCPILLTLRRCCCVPPVPPQASGYVEFDTAGQSNMYPVITKAYETGSAQDTLETGGANFAVGVGAGAIAVAVLALGLTALSQQGAGEQSRGESGSRSRPPAGTPGA